MPASTTDWTPTLELAGTVIATELAGTDAGDVVAISSLTFTYGRDAVFSATDGDTLSVELLVRSDAWLDAQGGTLGGSLIALSVTPPAGHLLTYPVVGWADPLFVGRVLPESVSLRPANRHGDAGWIVGLDAIDLRAWAGTIVVGLPAWPVETTSARLGRLNTLCLAKAGFGVDTSVPGAMGNPTLNGLDVDRRPVADVLDDLAAGLGVCWSWQWSVGVQQVTLTPLAIDSDTPPLAWAADGEHDPLRLGGVGAMTCVLPGRVMAADDETAEQSAGAVNEVRVDYTTATPTDATYVASDLASQTRVGIRSMSVSSQVRTLAAATEIGDRLIRLSQRLGRWRHPPVTWSASPPAGRPDVTANLQDAAARAATVLGCRWVGSADRALFVGGSIYNRMPGPGMGVLADAGAAVPYWQAIGGRLEYTGGRLSAGLTLAPRYFAAFPTEPTWADLTGSSTWADLAGSLANRSVAWADLFAFTT